MSEPVKRSYQSSRRDEQARETRARIRAAATELFVERGYAGTSIAAVAEAAGVAPQTVFVVFGNKARLLSEAIDVALAGDDLPVAVVDRVPATEVLTAPSSAEAAATFARMVTSVLERAGRLIQVADAAAQQDAELTPLWIGGHKGRLADMRQMATSFRAAGYLRDEVELDSAAELLWTISSPDTYRSFTVLLGWSTARYEKWVRSVVETSLFR